MSLHLSDYSMPCFILVDDNLGDLHLMQEALKRVFAHSKVHAFESGEAFRDNWEGLNTESQEIRACFIDYNMPGMSGRDVLKYLKAHTDLACPVYVFSGALLPCLKKEMLELGATDFLEKPIDFDALVELVSSLFLQQLPAA